jgi:hypothetical protein
MAEQQLIQKKIQLHFFLGSISQYTERLILLPTSQKNAEGNTKSKHEKRFAVSPPAINLPKPKGASDSREW